MVSGVQYCQCNLKHMTVIQITKLGLSSSYILQERWKNTPLGWSGGWVELVWKDTIDPYTLWSLCHQILNPFSADKIKSKFREEYLSQKMCPHSVKCWGKISLVYCRTWGSSDGATDCSIASEWHPPHLRGSKKPCTWVWTTWFRTFSKAFSTNDVSATGLKLFKALRVEHNRDNRVFPNARNPQ